MKKKLSILLFSIAIVFLFKFSYETLKTDDDVKQLRKQHQSYLNNNPYKETKGLSKKERKELGLPPNAYNEQVWELTLDPKTGRPMPERLMEIQEQLKQQRTSKRGVGGDSFNPWVDRGPNNVGGRTRGIMFDPNDADKNRVFAGGVSGGLWVNEDITDANSSWTLVPGIDANISVTSIIYDPNDLNTFYIGSGESYTSGDVIGRGVWKSTDGGVTWANIFGGITSTNGQLINGVFYINDIVARDIGATTELYIAVAGAFYGSSTSQFHGLYQQGLYKSTNGGTSWSKFTINESNGSPSNPNDIEIDLNNNIWFTTTRSNFGFNGGKIFKSTDGTTFALQTTIANARRTELEPSSTDANKFWVAADVNGAADLFFTNNAFTTISVLAEPNDADNGISATDYTRNQAFYDLVIEVDASDNLYVGGIDLFRSTDDGSTWTQISKWSNNANLNTLNIPLVHADHHAIVFRPNAPTEAVFGNDGGIYYSPDITAATASLDISSRNKDYNVTQFYYGSIASGTANEIILGGAQDNGTQISQNSVSGANDFDNYYAFFSGDGSYSEIDQDGGGITGRGEYMIVGSTYMSYFLSETSYTSTSQAYNGGYQIVSSGVGDFINQADLDDVGNILYANSTAGSTYRFSSFTLGQNSATSLDFTNALLDGEPSAFKVSPHTNTSLFVGTKNSKLLKITGLIGAPVWADISSNDFVGSISDIEIGDTDQEIFVTVHNYGVTSVWYTIDGGSNWSSKEGDLPDMPVKCILQNPLKNEEVLLGTDLGVWKTTDFFATNPVWTQSYNGMSDVSVLDLDLRVTDNTILASTYGRGMFTSTFSDDNNNITWTGTVNTDWATAGNWNTGVVPTTTDNVNIPIGGNQPEISATTGVSVNNLIVDTGASLSITNGGTLVVNGTSTGDITYNVAIPDTNWYLVSSPVVGEQYDDAWVTANSIASGTGNNRGIATYDNGAPDTDTDGAGSDTATEHWRYFQGGSATTFDAGVGYSMLRTVTGNYSFTG